MGPLKFQHSAQVQADTQDHSGQTETSAGITATRLDILVELLLKSRIVGLSDFLQLYFNLATWHFSGPMQLTEIRCIIQYPNPRITIALVHRCIF